MISRLRAMGITALAPYLVLSQSAFPIAAGSSDIAQKSRMLVAEAKSSPESSPAYAGVKLLHEIFLKLRGSSNQLALGTANRQFAAASQMMQGAINPLLIKPSERSSNRNSQLAYQAQDKKSYSGGFISSYANEDAEEGKRRDKAVSPMKMPMTNMGAAVNSGLASNAGNIKERDALLDAARSSPYASAVATATAASSAASSASSIASNSSEPMSLEKQLTKATRARGKALAAANNRLEPMQAPAASPGLSPQNAQILARSVSKLMQSTRQLSDLSQSESSIKTFGKAKAEMRDERTISTRPGGPVIQEYGQKDMNAATVASNLKAADDYAGGAPLMMPNQPAELRTVRTQLLALLPPSVVGGIPLARLGSTEQELGTTLSKKNATKQVIDDWTVWTLKGGSVQLYTRHSVVEAIRVFQPTYLGEEIGVNIGDSLTAIKSKFGEPAFILSEPQLAGHGTGSRNYVYPISHVAFQLALAKTQSAPQVVSVLIFDVQ